MRQESTTLRRWIRRAAWAVALFAVLYLGADLLLPGAASSVSQTSSVAATAASETSSVPATAAVSGSPASAPGRAALEASTQQVAETTPTYISELAPAVMVSPLDAATLPAAGAASNSSAHWPKLAGLALAFLGGLFIYAALAFRSNENT